MKPLAILLLLSVPAFSQDLSGSFRGLAAFAERRGGDPTEDDAALVAPFSPAGPTAPSGVVGASTRPGADNEPVTDVCRCQGYKHDVCKCLKAGVKCHCSRTSGSVWALTDGRWRKTGAKADPRITTSRKAPSESRSSDVLGAGYAVSKRDDGAWWWQAGGQWHRTTARLKESGVYKGESGEFVYRDGKMHRVGGMVVDIAPKSSGHWVTRCYGSFCRREWVAD